MVSYDYRGESRNKYELNMQRKEIGGRARHDVRCPNYFGQQRRPNRSSGFRQSGRRHDAEGILTRFPVVETANLDYLARDADAAVARVEIEGRQLDFYVTHLYGSREEDPLRHYQVQQFLAWIGARNDVSNQVVCGDFNATTDKPSAMRMADAFRPSQIQPTAFTALKEPGGQPSHPYWDRLDRFIDYVWVSRDLRVVDSGLCFDRPSADYADLWPSDNVGAWADLEFAAD